MSDTSSRLLRALRDLAIALINATLMLVLLCLILGWLLFDRVDSVREEFARNIVSVKPLRQDVQSMTAEISALRTDLAGIRQASGAASCDSAQAVMARLERFEGQLDTVEQKIGAFRERVQSIELDPDAMMTKAVETATNQFVLSAGQLAGCKLPGMTALKPLAQDPGSSAPQ